MASPQLEDGFVAIAYDLFGAIARAKLSATEKEVLLAVIYFTYGMYKTRANIDIEDIQIFISGDRRKELNRVEAAVKSLADKAVLYVIELNQHQTIMGIQKDFERWGTNRELTQKVQLLRSSNINTNNTITSKSHKLCSIQEYAYSNTDFKFGHTTYGVERKFTRLLLVEALSLTGSSAAAAAAIKDYIDELRSQEWFEANVKMRFSYMHSRFRQWYKSIPAKPRSVLEDEQDTGYRHKWNIKNRKWVMSDDKI